jgi:hypothetical protein
MLIMFISETVSKSTGLTTSTAPTSTTSTATSTGSTRSHRDSATVMRSSTMEGGRLTTRSSHER